MVYYDIGKNIIKHSSNGQVIILMLNRHPSMGTERRVRLNGTKFGCGRGICGACSIHINGEAIRSCQIRVEERRQNVTTIEGLGEKKLHPVQEAWLELQVPQCGYCQSGQIMMAASLLANNPTLQMNK